MSLRNTLWLVVLLALNACAGVASVPSRDSTARATGSAAMRGDDARPAHAQGWVRSELYFGVGTQGDAASTISPAQWRAFLDREVTPRFPDGLTVFDAYGQWLFRGQQGPERLDSKVLVILHEDTPQRRADIQAIRRAWKQATGDQSVLWSLQPAEVSF